ncbi:sugar transferase, partial [Candidatus Parcubacteria bacterium]
MLKRAMDLVLGSVAFVALFPVMALVALGVWWDLGRPILFRQLRAGQHGKPFVFIKFRTMREVYDENGDPLPDEQRLTRFGRWLRETSLDELPSLWHVIKGEMSLVGPRPLLPEYVPLYTPEQARRLEVKPGITGWAQVHGRNALSWEERFALDVWYVDHQSFWLDCKILWMTLWKVLKREGISMPGHATAEKFRGSAER